MAQPVTNEEWQRWLEDVLSGPPLTNEQQKRVQMGTVHWPSEEEQKARGEKKGGGYA